MKDDIIRDYGHCPLGKYLRVCAICREDLDDLTRQARIIGVLADLNESEVYDMPLAEYREWAAALAFLEDPDARPERIARAYRLGDMELCPVTDIRKITAGQYIDFQQYAAQGNEDNFPEMLSVLLVPKGCEYNRGYDIAEVQRAIREHMSVSQAIGLTAFFLKKWGILILNSLTFSEREMRGLPPEARERLTETLNRLKATLSPNSGDGSQTLTRRAKLSGALGRMFSGVARSSSSISSATAGTRRKRTGKKSKTGDGGTEV